MDDFLASDRVAAYEIIGSQRATLQRQHYTPPRSPPCFGSSSVTRGFLTSREESSLTPLNEAGGGEGGRLPKVADDR